MLAQLNEKTDKTEQDMNDEFEVLAKMVSQASKRKGRVRLSFIRILFSSFIFRKQK